MICSANFHFSLVEATAIMSHQQTDIQTLGDMEHQATAMEVEPMGEADTVELEATRCRISVLA